MKVNNTSKVMPQPSRRDAMLRSVAVLKVAANFDKVYPKGVEESDRSYRMRKVVYVNGASEGSCRDSSC